MKASRRPRWLVFVAMALIMAACGDDGGSALIPSTTTTTAAVTTTTAAVTTTTAAATTTTAAVTTTTAAATTTTAAVTTTTAAATTTTAVATTTTAVVAIDCDTPAQQIGLGQSVTAAMEATNRPYPANARYYCVDVPGGTGRVTIDLTGITADLDIYVGFGSIESVQGVDISRGETYEWLSNAFGTGDERVVINGPEPGVYYIEVTSYEGESSPYTLSVSG